MRDWRIPDNKSVDTMKALRAFAFGREEKFDSEETSFKRAQSCSKWDIMDKDSIA